MPWVFWVALLTLVLNALSLPNTPWCSSRAGVAIRSAVGMQPYRSTGGDRRESPSYIHEVDGELVVTHMHDVAPPLTEDTAIAYCYVQAFVRRRGFWYPTHERRSYGPVVHGTLVYQSDEMRAKLEQAASEALTPGVPVGSYVETTRAVWWPGMAYNLIPLMLAALVINAAPSLWPVAQWRARRARRRHEQGHCPACGYDLRGSPERCPECGEGDAPAVATPEGK